MTKGGILTVAAAVAALMAGSVMAQTAVTPPARIDGHPNFTGLWTHAPSGSAGRAFQVSGAAGPQHTAWTVREGNMNYLEIDAEFIVKAEQDMPAYKPEMWQKVRDFEEYGYRRGADPDYGCKNPGVVRLDAPAEVFQSAGKITLIYTGPADDGTSGHIWVREIPTDGRPLPKADDYEGLRPTGTSSAHWEGDTLVIETVDFPADGVWYNVRGWIGSDLAKVTERLHREGDKLLFDQTVDDPNFVKPWVRPTIVLNPDRRATSLLAQPLTCIERDASLLPPSSK